MSPAADPQTAQTAAEAHATGLWSFLGIVASGLFGWLAKHGWEQRKVKPVPLAHCVHKGDMVALQDAISDLTEGMTQLRLMHAAEAQDRAAFRATIEARMATRDDLHTEAGHIGDRMAAGLADVHTRLNDHVRDYHRGA